MLAPTGTLLTLTVSVPVAGGGAGAVPFVPPQALISAIRLPVASSRKTRALLMEIRDHPAFLIFISATSVFGGNAHYLRLIIDTKLDNVYERLPRLLLSCSPFSSWGYTDR